MYSMNVLLYTEISILLFDLFNRRQNVMVPLAWAMARTLKYQPSDPLHYATYQLLCWKHDHVTQTKKDSIHEVIALATSKMDRKFIVSAINFQC